MCSSVFAWHSYIAVRGHRAGSTLSTHCKLCLIAERALYTVERFFELLH